MSIKIPTGLKAIVHADTAAIAENAARYRAGGSKFVPAWRVYVYGPSKKLPRGSDFVWHLTDDPGNAVALYGAFDFEATGLRPMSTFDKFPYRWAPRQLQSLTAWLETEKGLVLNPDKTEEVTNNG